MSGVIILTMSAARAHARVLNARPQVDSKDKVRAELRRLLMRNVTKNKADRDYFRDLRQRYHVSIRTERSFYWVDRLKPALAPEEWLTVISDGAAQKWYTVPRAAGVTSRETALPHLYVAR